jgi:hypothetical protein
MSERFARVVLWHKYPERRGRASLGSGFARLMDDNGSTYNQPSLYLKEENIITEGIETLKRGTIISCRIGEPDPGFTTPLALDVSVYLDSTDLADSSSDSNSDSNSISEMLEPQAQE